VVGEAFKAVLKGDVDKPTPNVRTAATA